MRRLAALAVDFLVATKSLTFAKACESAECVHPVLGLRYLRHVFKGNFCRFWITVALAVLRPRKAGRGMSRR